MIEVEYMLICEQAYQDERGLHCMLGIYDHLNAHAIPFTCKAFDVAVRLRGTATGSVKLHFQLIAPDGMVLAESGGQVQLTPDGTLILCVNFRDVGFLTYGVHVIRLTANEKTVMTLDFPVRQVPPPAGQAQTTVLH